MTELWVMIYYIPLMLLFAASVVLRDKDCIIITFVSLVAFAVTRLITETVTGERYMYDFANDLFVCVTFLWFIRGNKIARWLIITYTLMALLSYIPYAADLLSNRGRAISLEILSTLQLIIIFGGLIYGTRNRRLAEHNYDDNSGIAAMVRGSAFKRYTKKVATLRTNKTSKNGDHALLEKGN